MDIDLTAVADEVAEKIWDARLMLSGDKPYKELPLQHQNGIKEQILPVLFHAVPVIEKSIKDKIDREIKWDTDANSWNESQDELDAIRESIKNL